MCISSKHEDELLHDRAISSSAYHYLFQGSFGPHNLRIGPSSLPRTQKKNKKIQQAAAEHPQMPTSSDIEINKLIDYNFVQIKFVS